MLKLRIIITGLILAFSGVGISLAAPTTPQQLVYNGHLLSPTGTPITTPHTVRFSIWNSSDYGTSDTISGAINTFTPTYLGWQEEHTVTPNARGYFSINLGSVTPLFSVVSLSSSDLQSMFLQIEVKQSAEPITSYEVLDVDPANSTVDRTPVLSVPFALNADYLDQREIGTGSGDIAILSDGGVFSPSLIPAGTFRDYFTIDTDNTSTGDITLQFGTSLAKTLTYDQVAGYFRFNDDVHITGDLFVTGLINGVDITTLGSVTNQLEVSDAGGLNINVSAGSYRINGVTVDYAGASGIAIADNQTTYLYFDSAGLQQSLVAFPTNESAIRLATVTTVAGAITTIDDARVTLSDDRGEVKVVKLNPMYPETSYTPSGSNNVGALKVSFDTPLSKNYYVWQSTKPTLQTYTVVVHYQLPSNFKSFTATPLIVEYRTGTASAADANIAIAVLDTVNAPVTLVGASSNLSSTTWATTALSFGGSPTLTAGDTITIKLTTASRNFTDAMLGELRLEYTTL